MKFTTLFRLASLIASVQADGYVPGENYSTFTPTDGYLSGATTQFTQPFGIAVNPIVSSIVLSSVTTQGTVVVTQIGDGQIQATTATPSPVVVTQIGDGQIQASTYTPTTETIAVVTQIGDGQIQATTLTTVTRPTSSSTTVTEDSEAYSSITFTSASSETFDSESVSTDSAASTISTTSLFSSSSSSSSFFSPSSSSSASISSPTLSSSSASSSSSSVASSLSSDDLTTTYTVTPTDTVYATVTSANLPILSPTTVVVEKRSTETEAILFEKRDLPSTCSSDSSLSMTLQDSVLYDSHGRVGAIVSNEQFQFDGPPPQAGSIYAAGWSIVNGKLALGTSTTFYQCLSGNFYNLYYQSIGEQCTAVELDVVLFKDC